MRYIWFIIWMVLLVFSIRYDIAWIEQKRQCMDDWQVNFTDCLFTDAPVHAHEYHKRFGGK